MKLLLFELSGDMALWRNVYESMSAFSCIGPAPSNLAGLLGAALGFASPRSQAATAPDESMLKEMWKNGLPWPVSAELLQWEAAYDLRVACAWTGGFPRRMPWNVNGLKEVKKGDNLRMQQQVILNPKYTVAVTLNDSTELKRVCHALQKPAFPLFLGASFCRAIIKNVFLCNSLPEHTPWAFRVAKAAIGECVPFSQHVQKPEDHGYERIISAGYWVYPTPDSPGILQGDPFVSCLATLEEK